MKTEIRNSRRSKENEEKKTVKIQAESERKHINVKRRKEKRNNQ